MGHRSVSLKSFGGRISAVVLAFVLVAGIGGIAASVVVNSGTLGGFEQDGNLTVDAGFDGDKDWANVNPIVVPDDPNPDSGFQGSSKEEDPANWVCQDKLGGITPAKDDIHRAYISTRMSATEAWLDLAYAKEKATGDTHVNFEFNKKGAKANLDDCSYDRQLGDLLVTYDYPGGDDPADIRAWSWSNGPCAGSTDDLCWKDLGLSSNDAKAATNATDITDPLDGGATIVQRNFGEVTLDLTASKLAGFVGCPGFGFANVRSRSSGESFTSALQDRLPTVPVDLNTCGKIIIKKVDDAGAPVQGAVFGLFDNAAATGAPVKTATTGADGKATFDDVKPGDYWVKEISAPAGYKLDAKIVKVTVGFRETKDLSGDPWVNPRKTPKIEVQKDGPGIAHAGGLATFNFKVTNTGELDLTNVKVTDSVFGDIGTLASLPIGAVDTSLSKTVTVNATAGNPDPCDDDEHYNVAKASGKDMFDRTVEDTEDECTELKNPGIKVTKTAARSPVHAGEMVEFTFKAENTGNVDLVDVDIVDDVYGLIASDETLGVGASKEIKKDFVVPGTNGNVACPDGHFNTAKVTANDTLVPPKSVESSDDECVNIADPKIQVVKDGPGKLHAGDKAMFTFNVSNIGDVDLIDVAVTDSEFGNIGTIAELKVAESKKIEKEFTVPGPTGDVQCPDGHYNVATATGKDKLTPAKTVTDDDDHCVDLIDPNLEVDKDGPGRAHAGDVVTYTFKVTNTGDVALTNVLVVDDQFGAIDTIDLALGETKTITKDFTVPGVVPGPGVCDEGHYNVVTASAVDELGKAISDSDDHCVELGDPAIQVVKDGEALAHEGDEVVYTFTVTNIGEVDLFDVTVTDDVLGDIGSVASLLVGDSTVLQKSFTVPVNVDGVDNIATACGVDDLAKEVCDDDPHSLLVIHPDVEIVKTVDNDTTSPGQTVTYTFEVTNVGDTALFDVLVTDDILGDIGTIDVLEPGATEVLTKSMLVAADSPRTNIATACGTDALDLEVCDDDDAVITIVLPQPPLSRQLPNTGFAALAYTALATVLIGFGLAMVDKRRRMIAEEM